MARRPFLGRQPKQTGPRANDQITVDMVRLIDQDGKNHDTVELGTALEMARAAGLDLVEISPNAEPPVCKILDYGRFKFEAQKKANVARKKQKTQSVKEIKMRPGIDVHDYDVKMKAMVKFLDDGDKVKVTMRFRGREMAHKELGLDVLKRVEGDLGKLAKVESLPKLEGRQMSMVLSPK